MHKQSQRLSGVQYPLKTTAKLELKVNSTLWPHGQRHPVVIPYQLILLKQEAPTYGRLSGELTNQKTQSSNGCRDFAFLRPHSKISLSKTHVVVMINMSSFANNLTIVLFNNYYFKMSKTFLFF